MTISEAVSLVLRRRACQRREMLDMGKPVKIVTLAENLIKLSGYQPYKDIDIKFRSATGENCTRNCCSARKA